MASEKQDQTRKLTAEERKETVEALKYAQRLAERSGNQHRGDEVLQNHYDAKARRLNALANRFATTELDIQ